MMMAEWQVLMYEDAIPFIWRRHAIESGDTELVRGMFLLMWRRPGIMPSDVLSQLVGELVACQKI